MVKKDSLKEMISTIQEYNIKNLNGKLTILGLNDDRGFNFQKNILMYLKEFLENEKYDIQLIDAFSMFFNKTRHIDYYLEHNISLEEIMLMQEYGTANELRHALGFNLPFLNGCSKVINNALRAKIEKEQSASDIRISDLIMDSEKPVVVYASGVNDIMYELHIDPFNLKKFYKLRNIHPRYDHAVGLVTEQTIKKIVDGHKRNFENILGLNNSADIFALSAYLYTKMDKDYEQVFKEAILMYNEHLEKLCKEYQVSYVNSRVLEGTKYNNVILNYISKYPPYILACEIIKKMYENIQNGNAVERVVFEKPSIVNDGAFGVMCELEKDIERATLNAENSTGYEIDIWKDKAFEHSREKEVFEKVIKKYDKFYYL